MGDFIPNMSTANQWNRLTRKFAGQFLESRGAHFWKGRQDLISVSLAITIDAFLTAVPPHFLLLLENILKFYVTYATLVSCHFTVQYFQLHKRILKQMNFVWKIILSAPSNYNHYEQLLVNQVVGSEDGPLPLQYFPELHHVYRPCPLLAK